MKHEFGWGLPPGVSDQMIEEQAGAFEEEIKYPWSLKIRPLLKSINGGTTWENLGFNIEIYDDKPYASNYNLPTEMNTPDYYFAANVEELLEFLKGVYEEEKERNS